MSRRNSHHKQLLKKFDELTTLPTRDLAAPVNDFVEDLARRIADRAPVAEGDLKASVEVEKLRQFVWEVAVNSDHAAANEFGNAKMPAHPFMRPEINAAKARFAALVHSTLNRALQRIRGR